jgi:hypothetical protein
MMIPDLSRVCSDRSDRLAERSRFANGLAYSLDLLVSRRSRAACWKDSAGDALSDRSAVGSGVIPAQA